MLASCFLPSDIHNSEVLIFNKKFKEHEDQNNHTSTNKKKNKFYDELSKCIG